MEELLDVLIPKDLKDITLPTPEELNYWNARKQRTFFIDYEIDESYSIMELVKTIIQMNIEEKDIPKEELKPIFLWIHSFGGDVYQRSIALDILLSSRIPIVTIAMGTAMSSGFDIFLAGTRRYAFEHSSLMMHSGYGSMQGTQSELAEANKNNKYRLEQDKKYVLSRTSIPETKYARNKDRDWYFTIDEVKDYGIAKIVTSFEEII